MEKEKENFGDKIKKIIKDAGYDYKVRVFPKKDEIRKKDGKRVIQEYDKVVVYAGRHIEKIAQKRSLRLVAWKQNGKWQGDLEAVKMQGGKGDKIYIRDYHDTTEPLKYVMYSDLDWNDDEEYAKQQLLKVLENWKFIENERLKLTN